MEIKWRKFGVSITITGTSPKRRSRRHSNEWENIAECLQTEQVKHFLLCYIFGWLFLVFVPCTPRKGVGMKSRRNHLCLTRKIVYVALGHSVRSQFHHSNLALWQFIGRTSTQRDDFAISSFPANMTLLFGWLILATSSQSAWNLLYCYQKVWRSQQACLVLFRI